MSIYKTKKSPYWQYDFVLQGVRFHGSTGQRSKVAAQKVEDQKRKEAAEGPQRDKITLNAAFGLYWSNVAHRQPSARTTRSQTKNLLRGLGPDRVLSDVTQRMLVEHYTRRLRSVTVATANREIQLAKRVWKYCDEVLGIDTGPSIAWNKITQREATERVRELTADEEARLFSHLRPDLHDFVRFCLLVGVRLSGGLSLRWDDVDFDAKVFRVRNKGGGSVAVPLTRGAEALIRRQKPAKGRVWTYPVHRARQGVQRGEWLPITENVLKRPWEAAVKAAGIEDLRFHDLRHTAATRTLRASKNLRAVQLMLGHANISTTTRYAHALMDDVRAAMEEVDG